jgi:hypothetical protein
MPICERLFMPRAVFPRELIFNQFDQNHSAEIKTPAITLTAARRTSLLHEIPASSSGAIQRQGRAGYK